MSQFTQILLDFLWTDDTAVIKIEGKKSIFSMALTIWLVGYNQKSSGYEEYLLSKFCQGK